MATVNILISDQPGGLFVKLTSDEPMPQDEEDGGSIAQNAGLICLAVLKSEIRQVTGKEPELANIQ
ncbi:MULTISPECIES: hypothetical protein [Neisseria]|uniref:hypothetical protein n=1 Tax=Neisseria TaxID=482 RepID=UPI0002F53A60|nr:MULTISPECIES: hypothetical protein [Neisseria]MBD0764352.1 hypothetical protein [Neisseria sp. RH3002v2f]